jgi:hypothetical protein
MKTTLPPVRPGCGICENCRTLKYLRYDFVTALIAPDRQARTLKAWETVQAQHPCTEMEACNDCGALIPKADQLCGKCRKEEIDREDWELLHPEARCPVRE